MNIEKADYEKRWSGDEGSRYSGERQGYTPFFLSLMDRWMTKLPQGSKCLEVGCGDGYFSSEIVRRNLSVTGIDFSSEGVRRAQERTPEARFVVHDLTQPLPFEADSFSAVWCSEVLEHLFSPLFVLQEIQRVLRPGGMALLTVPYHGLLKNLAIAAFAFEKHFDPEYPHLRFFTIRSLASLVRKAGLSVVETATCGSQLGYLRDTLFPTNILLVARK